MWSAWAARHQGFTTDPSGVVVTAGSERWRRLAVQVEPLAGAGVRQLQPMGMQQVARIARQGVGARQGKATWPVERIPHQGMSRPGQVDADLVGTARPNLHLHERGSFPAFQHGHVALRRAPPGLGSVKQSQGGIGHFSDGDRDCKGRSLGVPAAQGAVDLAGPAP